MSNFTKSIIYSVAVLAVGIIGVMAVYDKDIHAPAGIEPAAGDSDLGLDFSDAIDEANKGMPAPPASAGDESQTTSAPASADALSEGASESSANAQTQEGASTANAEPNGMTPDQAPALEDAPSLPPIDSSLPIPATPSLEGAKDAALNGAKDGAKDAALDAASDASGVEPAAAAPLTPESLPSDAESVKKKIEDSVE